VTPRYVTIANPDSLRFQAFAPALEAFWSERGVRAESVVVPWSEVVPRLGNLDGLSAFDRPAVLRLESPGRDWDVARQLIQAGDPEGDYLDLEYRKGRSAHPRLFYAGFVRVLEGLRQSFASRPHLHVCADPRDVAEMFDKNATCARLAAAGIPIPPTLTAIPDTPTALIDEVRRRRWSSAYVKLNTGSSASAIAVLHPGEAAPWATSSLIPLEDGFYSTRRLTRLTGANLDAVLCHLLEEEACVQQGIRMAQIDSQNFDVRVVVVHGEVAFTIFRLSHNPMTNLHLGGQRGEVERCRAAIPTRAWLDGLDHCVEAARLYRAEMVGIDLLFESGFVRHYLLEVNAFGDFFPNLVDGRGRSVHAVEIESTARALGWIT
jgi:hypothetical protein